MSNNISIEERVMANVGVIYTARKAFGPTALKAYILALSAIALWKLVWVTRILQNFTAIEKNGIASIANYLAYAVLHTHPVVQATLAVAAVTSVLLVVDLVRSASGDTTRRHSLSF